MLHWNTVLFASDLTDSSRIAYPMACALAKDHGARLIVLHVIPRGTHDFLLLAQLGQGQSNLEFEKNIHRSLRTSHPTDEAVPTKYELLYGDPAHVIVATTRDEKCDLAVLGTRGHSGWHRMFIGNVADHVLRGASCPVLVVKDTWRMGGVETPGGETLAHAAVR